jgi:hypothetical protein
VGDGVHIKPLEHPSGDTGPADMAWTIWGLFSGMAIAGIDVSLAIGLGAAFSDLRASCPDEGIAKALFLAGVVAQGLASVALFMWQRRRLRFRLPAHLATPSHHGHVRSLILGLTMLSLAQIYRLVAVGSVIFGVE